MLGDCSTMAFGGCSRLHRAPRRRQCPSRGSPSAATAPGSWGALLQPFTAVGTLRRILAFRLSAFDAQRTFVGYSIALSARRFERSVAKRTHLRFFRRRKALWLLAALTIEIKTTKVDFVTPLRARPP